MKEKINLNGLKILFFIFIIIWGYFFLEMIFPQLKYLFGIEPRNFKIINFISLFLSWISHENFSHIMNNSIVLFTMLPFICLFEKNVLKIISGMIIITGIYVWMFGASNSIHIGASGLAYSSFGFMIVSLFLFKKWLYSIPVISYLLIYGFSYFLSFTNGLIPKDGISFSGHLGGFIAGIIISILNNKSFDKNNK